MAGVDLPSVMLGAILMGLAAAVVQLGRFAIWEYRLRRRLRESERAAER
jgi:hypothetical protein